MQITFRASPKLLKVGEIGESIVESDDSFRKQFSILILGAVRTGKIPFRNKNGFKLPLESLEITERETRDFAKRRIEAKLPVPICEFDADLHHVIQIAAAQPWMNVETQLQALAAEGENHRQWVEAEIETETDRLLDGWYWDGSVLVSEAAEWFCKEHDFEGTFVESSIVGNGEIARKLAKWFDKSIGDLPQKPRSIAEAYIPEWPELSGADRRARADEADQRLQGTLGARFERARREAQQADDATPDRFAQRAIQDGFDKVTREKAGERNFEAKVSGVNLSDKRCTELAHSHELRIADWTALTGIGIGVHWSYLVTTEGVAFRNWTEREIREASVDQQIDMHHDNAAMPLIFPCTPARPIQFVDAAPPGSHSFSIPDAFRQQVLELAQTAGVSSAPTEQPLLSDNGRSGAPKLTPDGEGKQANKKKNHWTVEARAIADEYFENDTSNKCRDSLAGYSTRVMQEMQKRKIHGPRGPSSQLSTFA